MVDIIDWKYKEELGNKLAVTRKKNKMNQIQLADFLSVTISKISKWECGQSIPSLDIIFKIAEFYKVEPYYFLGNICIDLYIEATKTPCRRGQKLSHIIKAWKSNDTNSSMSLDDYLLQNRNLPHHIIPKQKYFRENLCGTDFSGVDLSGSVFRNNKMSGANFENANLTDSILYFNDLSGVRFKNTELIRTQIKSSELHRLSFIDTCLTDVVILTKRLIAPIFKNCIFKNVIFNSGDVNGICFDGQSFNNVKFEGTIFSNTTFRDSTLKNVTFLSSFAIKKKYFKTIKTVCFRGAKMDEKTYLSLKSMAANLEDVIVVD
ncbi:pentapeptide repeat-containing protein [Chryseobacterium sp. Ch-15]|uniref:Pentapeptide repeat-containing protein n=1 Tax=Chryseobacterium muglaense TaxID=2893752 RepID=A0A9Q3USB0_9FLAO|nr:pentapeptide repeat-containing protein [Chryseobacterium muglaense]MBD3906151.1 pentapeptide repeat-containing protein [Chryseobacterium muglaense]MCC9033707.1 pentapeptide repeat-containing protein [Chryseobacterium muglaense]MCM2554782.1 pentapeptide repeat-containing protein [Chryseobacterium muglaense]